MITFYPDDIELWNKTGEFDFSCRAVIITLEARQIYDYKVFHGRYDFVEFLRKHTTNIENAKRFPLEITKLPKPDYSIFSRGVTHSVSCGNILLGWVNDDLR